MVVELIPVVEINYNTQEVPAPDKHPYWENAELWDKYHSEVLGRAGFKDTMTPYLGGSCFYKLTEITDANLAKLTIDHIGEFKEQSCGFYGGFILRVDNQDRLFPQCCGELADIQFWTNIADGKHSRDEGHPGPVITFKGSSVRFDLRTGEQDEPFQPTPPIPVFQVDKMHLWMAVENAKLELRILAERLERINISENLGIPGIENLLIRGNGNYN